MAPRNCWRCGALRCAIASFRSRSRRRCSDGMLFSCVSRSSILCWVSAGRSRKPGSFSRAFCCCGEWKIAMTIHPLGEVFPLVLAQCVPSCREFADSICGPLPRCPPGCAMAGLTKAANNDAASTGVSKRRILVARGIVSRFSRGEWHRSGSTLILLRYESFTREIFCASN